MVYVYEMMHLLDSAVNSKDVMHHTLKKVYHNFTSIDKVVVPLIAELDRTFPGDHNCYELREITGSMVTFLRYMLGRIFEEDGITINPSLADLLAEIELLLVNIVKECDSDKLRCPSNQLHSKISQTMERIQEVYYKPTPINSYQLIINYDMMIEFLDDFGRSFDYRTQNLKENVILVRDYLELLNKDRTKGDNLEIMIAVEKVAFEMAKYAASFQRYSNSNSYSKTQLFHIGVLKALVLHSDGFSRSTQVMSDELVIRYAKWIQDNLLNLLDNDEIDVSDTLKGQLMYLHGRLSFLCHLLPAYPLKHISELEKLRLDFQALARGVGYVICLYSESPKIDETSLGLFDLVNKANVINEEIIKLISVMILQETERESPKNDQLGSLIILLQKLKEIMDYTPGMIVTWRDHENLVLFIFYLYQNNIRGDIHSGTSPINHEELEGILVIAFNMASNSLLARYGKFCWWELYLRAKKHVDKHMYAGILKAIVLSSAIPLTDELLISYGECVHDSLNELLRDKNFDPVKGHFKILHKGFSFLWRLLINYSNEEKLSHIKVSFQDLVRSIGSEVCSCFTNWLTVDMANQSTAEPSHLVEKMNLIIVEAEELIHSVHIHKIGHESPKTNQLGSFNLLLQNWKGLVECESDLMITWKDQFQIIHKNLVLLKTFITSNSTKDDLCSSIMDAGYVAEYLLTTFYVGICPVLCTSIWISEFMDHLERIKAIVTKLQEKKCFAEEISDAGKAQVSFQPSHVPTLNNVLVGFEVEIQHIRKQLYSRLKQLDVISIVGMPGLGKTTLARKIYEDSSSVKYFDACAWCTVSQDYNKKEMLLAILGSIIQLTDETKKLKESELSVMIHKQLKGRRYFIVLDDIWDIKAFMYLKCFFPDDNNGSRVMLTSRSKVIGSQAQGKSQSNLIEPGLLNDEQSWDLLARKVYDKEKCPDVLSQIGKDIAKKCKGLPLGVVVVGGVLAKGPRERDFWERVLENLCMYLARDSQSQFFAALELSYEYLPHYLKPMFLYLGAFPEDEEIHATKLMRFWSAEGFLQNTESMCLESQAEKCLMDLIDRSLIMISKWRWDGRVKVCRVHDLLRDLCLTKAKEDKFMQQIHIHAELPNPVWYQRRLSIHLDGNDENTLEHLAAYKDLPRFAITTPTYSILFFDVGSDFDSRDLDGDFISSLKLLKIFNAGAFNITQDVFNKDLIMLVHLRYVSIVCNNLEYIPSSISRLRSLESLTIIHNDDFINYQKKKNDVIVPETIWEMTKLRHMHIGDKAKFTVAREKSYILDNLQTFSMPMIDIGEEEKIFKKVPNLKKLRCGFKKYNGDDAQFPNFESLGKLESLRLRLDLIIASQVTGLRGQLKLPLTLKKLTISRFKLKWSQISIFHRLHNLEYLKVEPSAVCDQFWDMGDDDIFTKLKFLSIGCRLTKRWSASYENFPCLEKLVLYYCSSLTEIPSDLGEFYTLQTIKVEKCPIPLEKLVKRIQQEQEENDNDSLKFHFHANKGQTSTLGDRIWKPNPCMNA